MIAARACRVQSVGIHDSVHFRPPSLTRRRARNHAQTAQFRGDSTMAAKAWVWAVAACVGLLGCAMGLDGGGGGRALTDQTCTSKKNCEIGIDAPYCPIFGHCTATVDYDRTLLAAGEKDINIVWHLPPGFVFCADLGDGVFLKYPDPDAQFDDKYPTEKMDGAKPSKKECKELRHYHWRGLNTKSKPKDPYEYKIVFHDDAFRKQYWIDPWIINR
jgi:hypothetical protein